MSIRCPFVRRLGRSPDGGRTTTEVSRCVHGDRQGERGHGGGAPAQPGGAGRDGQVQRGAGQGRRDAGGLGNPTWWPSSLPECEPCPAPIRLDRVLDPVGEDLLRDPGLPDLSRLPEVPTEPAWGPPRDASRWGASSWGWRAS